MALSSEELIEKNLASWQSVISRYEGFIKDNEPVNQGFLPVFGLIKKIAMSEMAKLFRAGTSLYSLLISPAEKHGLRESEPFVAIDVWRNKNPKNFYYRGQVKVTESDPCESTDILFESLQLFSKSSGVKLGIRICLKITTDTKCIPKLISANS